MSHIFPKELLEQHLVCLGKTGAGKSSAMRFIVEGLLDRGERVCIIDPKGDWWGIKSSADGKHEGYALVIFGDQMVRVSDQIPINPRVGKEVAELVATGNRPCVIGFRGWMPSDRTKFWIDFASTLFNRNDSRLYLVIDEVHNFAPQGKVLDPEAGKCLHWTNRLATEGRGIGIVLLMASQRPQKVHKDTLTCAETLIAMRVVHKLDRDAIKDWVEGAGDPERARLVLNSLAEMQRGEAYVWYPEGKFFKRLLFPKFKTFDSFKAPSPDQRKHEPQGWAAVDLNEIKQKLASAIQDAKQSDPIELKRQIIALQAELQRKPTSRIDESVVARAVQQARQQVEKEFVATVKELQTVVSRQQIAIRKAVDLLVSSSELLPVPQRRPVATVSPPRQAQSRVAVPSSTNSLTNPEQRILDAIASFEAIGIDTPEQVAVAFAASYRWGTGAFNNPRGALRTKGLVEYVGNKIRLTEEGRQLARAYSLTTEELHKRVLGRLRLPEQRILRPLLAAYPDSLTEEELLEHSGYRPGGAFNNPRGRLRALGLIDYLSGSKVIKASDWLFPVNATVTAS